MDGCWVCVYLRKGLHGWVLCVYLRKEVKECPLCRIVGCAQCEPALMRVSCLASGIELLSASAGSFQSPPPSPGATRPFFDWPSLLTNKETTNRH